MRSTWSRLITSLTVGSAGRAARLGEQVDALPPHPLERVGVRARLERAAAQHDGAARAHGLRGNEHLLPRLDRAGTGNDHEVAAADDGVSNAKLGTFRLRRACSFGPILGAWMWGMRRL
jgi:hypothetical protein